MTADACGNCGHAFGASPRNARRARRQRTELPGPAALVSPGRAPLAIALEIAQAYVGAAGMVGIAARNAVSGMSPDNGFPLLAGVSQAVAWITVGGGAIGLLSVVAHVRWLAAARRETALLTESPSLARGWTWPAFVVPIYSFFRPLTIYRSLRGALDPRRRAGVTTSAGAAPPVEAWFATRCAIALVGLVGTVSEGNGPVSQLVVTALYCASGILTVMIVSRTDAWLRAAAHATAGDAAEAMPPARAPVLTATFAGILGIAGAAALVTGTAAARGSLLPFLVAAMGIPAGALAVAALRRVPARAREVSLGAVCAITAAGAALFAARLGADRRAHCERLWAAYKALPVAIGGAETWDGVEQHVTEHLDRVHREAASAPTPYDAVSRCGAESAARNLRTEVARRRADAAIRDVQHLPRVLSADELRGRIALVERYVQTTDASKTTLMTALDEVARCLRDARVPEKTIQAFLRGANADTAPHVEMRTMDLEYGSVLRSALQVLLDEDGAWTLRGGVVFERGDALRRWNAAQLQLHDVDRRVASALRRHGATPRRETERDSPLEARRGFLTRPPKAGTPGVPSPRATIPRFLDPPRKTGFSRVRYHSPAGDLAAYVTPDPKDGRRHPVIVWAHVGLGAAAAERFPGTMANLSVQAFEDAGITVVLPTFRGDPGNPGKPELYWGELEDLLAARELAATLPWIDHDFIYLGGRGRGGTLALLSAASTDAYRAVFALSPIVDLASEPESLEDAPFDTANPRELELRSPIRFTPHLRRPTFLLDAGGSRRARALSEMAELGGPSAGPVSTILVPTFDETAIVVPLARLIARTITRDMEGRGLQLGKTEVDDATADIRVTTEL